MILHGVSFLTSSSYTFPSGSMSYADAPVFSAIPSKLEFMLDNVVPYHGGDYL
jgi:hypothetical protein